MTADTTKQSRAHPGACRVRLGEAERRAIRSATAMVFGREARVILFGSRADPARRGGDIDLLVEVRAGQATLANELRLELEIKKRIGDRKVDIVLASPGKDASAIQRLARETGVAL